MKIFILVEVLLLTLVCVFQIISTEVLADGTHYIWLSVLRVASIALMITMLGVGFYCAYQTLIAHNVKIKTLKDALVVIVVLQLALSATSNLVDFIINGIGVTIDSLILILPIRLLGVLISVSMMLTPILVIYILKKEVDTKDLS